MAQTNTKDGTEVTSLERAYDLISDGGRTPAQLVAELGISRTMVQKITTELLNAGEIKRIGTGYAGATVFGVSDAPTLDPNHLTREKLGRVVGSIGSGEREQLIRAVDRPAPKGVMPGIFDHLIVTGIGLDTESGHAIAKLQRGDGTTWVVDLEAARVES